MEWNVMEWNRGTKKIEMVFSSMTIHSDSSRTTRKTMPCSIKKNDKKTARIFGVKTTYKKHRDDEDNKGIPESESGSGSDSEGEHSSGSSSVSVSVPQRGRRSNKRTMVVAKKSNTRAANMVVGKIAEALASSVIAAAIGRCIVKSYF
jgi:hypothetical protein